MTSKCKDRSYDYLDVKELVDFVLEYGKENSLPNMEGSGEAAYQAALRLQSSITTGDEDA